MGTRSAALVLLALVAAAAGTFIAGSTSSTRVAVAPMRGGAVFALGGEL